MKQRFYDAVEANPVIAAVKNEEGLKHCCELKDVKVVFILYGDICSIANIVDTVVSYGKIAMVHMDLVGGLGCKDIAVDFIKTCTQADGIISTKPGFIKRAKELGLYTIQRFFIIDSMALKSIENTEGQNAGLKPDFIEVLPGVMPKVLKKICKVTKEPVITGGLISDKEDVVKALAAGAISVSSTNEDVWVM